MNTPIQTLYLYLQSAGLFNDWIAHDGSTQPSPFVQTRLFDEQAAGITASTRILLIKSVGNSGTRYVSEPTFLFAVMGKAGESPAYAETYANLLYEALLDFEHADCIISIDPVSPVNGAHPMESGRSAYDMEFNVMVDSGHVGAGKL